MFSCISLLLGMRSRGFWSVQVPSEGRSEAEKAAKKAAKAAAKAQKEAEKAAKVRWCNEHKHARRLYIA